MTGCNHIRKLIDEAHKPDVLPFEVTEHIADCGECDRFASERTALRNLVASSARVTAPMNFDAMLKARLAEAKGRRSFSWISAPSILRFGAATAGLVIMIFAAQYTGLFSQQQKEETKSHVAFVSPGERITPTPKPPEVPESTQPPRNGGGRIPYANIRATRGARMEAAGRERVVVPPGSMSPEDGGVVLLRSASGGVDVPMPTVSIGAQPLLYVSAGQRTTRTVGTSSF